MPRGLLGIVASGAGNESAEHAEEATKSSNRLPQGTRRQARTASSSPLQVISRGGQRFNFLTPATVQFPDLDQRLSRRSSGLLPFTLRLIPLMHPTFR